MILGQPKAKRQSTLVIMAQSFPKKPLGLAEISKEFCPLITLLLDNSVKDILMLDHLHLDCLARHFY